MINPNTRKRNVLQRNVLQGEAREKFESCKAKAFAKDKKDTFIIEKYPSCSCGRPPIPGEMSCYRCSE